MKTSDRDLAAHVLQVAASNGGIYGLMLRTAASMCGVGHKSAAYRLANDAFNRAFWIADHDTYPETYAEAESYVRGMSPSYLSTLK